VTELPNRCEAVDISQLHIGNILYKCGTRSSQGLPSLLCNTLFTLHIQLTQKSFLSLIQGTTGHPKATLATHHGLVNNAIIVGKYMELDAEVLYMCAGPHPQHKQF
jgi:acyl-CoA synthetase (AMP-forming)/AMP-acid ligase II